MNKYSITITEDEALVLFEFFERFDKSDRMQFLHPAEYIALMRISSQIDRTTSAMLKPNYDTLLSNARSRIAEGFDGEVPGMKKET
jgi:hypothetical protein